MSRNTDSDFIPFSRPSFGAEEEEAVLRVLRSGWLTTGPEAAGFEAEWREVTGAEHALCVNSATAGLHLALLALGVGPGDRVAVPDYTFTATVEILRYIGAEPVFIDCAKDSFQMDTAHVEALLKNPARPLKAAIPVHFGGQPCQPAFWKRVRKEYGLIVVEDCAHAFPVATPAGFLGTIGDAGVFSFYANKTITTGEGGMVCVQTRQAADKIRNLRLHGIDRDAFRRYQSDTPSWRYDVSDCGFKDNMTDISAALGRVQLKKANQLLEARREVVRAYLERREEFPNWVFPVWEEAHAWHLFPVLVPRDSNRDNLIDALFQAGVGVSVHYIPLHRMTYWSVSAKLSPEAFPVAEELGQREISLPLWPGLGAQGANKVLDRLRSVLEARHG